MDKIICLVGESGSGKSTIVECLEREGYNYIKSYTTRPKRSENENGHIFVDESFFKNYYENKAVKENLIAYTEFHGYRYWSTESQYKGKGISIYTVEPSGAVELKKIIKDCIVIVIYLKVDAQERLKRMEKDRGREQALKRFYHDNEIELFHVIPCDYVVNGNRKIEFIVKDIKKIINQLED